MTSANSSSKMKLFWLTCRNRLWLIVLGFVVFLFALPVASGLLLQNYGEVIQESYALSRISVLLNYFRGVSAFAMGIAAILCGVVCFRYQHKRKQVDFYNSMPLKRGSWFAINYLSGLAIFLFCYLVNTAINCVVIAGSDFAAWFSWSAYLRDIGMILCFFFMLYSLVVFAMNISGTTLTALLVLVVVNSVLPAIIGLKELLFTLFFDSYLAAMHDVSSLMINSSPVAKLIEVASRVDYSLTPTVIVATLILGLVLLAAAFVLGVKRPSESAGQAFVFRPVYIVVKYLISIVCTFYFALFFYVTGMQSNIWLFFGAAAGAVLSYHFLNIWFTLDFKTITKAKNWLGALIVFVVVGACYIGFLTDITDYDGYLPEQSEVASVSIYMPELDSYADATYNTSNQYYQSQWRYLFQNHEIENMYQLTDETAIAAALNIASSGIDEINRLKTLEQNPELMLEENSTSASTDSVNTASYDIGGKQSVWVIYTLDNGKQVGRIYGVPLSEMKSDLLTVLDSAQYRDNHFIINQYAAEGKLYMVSACNFGYNTYLPYDLSLEELRQIASVYAEEHRNLSLESRESRLPVGFITLRIYFEQQPTENFLNLDDADYYADEDGAIWVEQQYPIYAEFTETRALIEQAVGSDIFASDLAHIDYVEVQKELTYVDDISASAYEQSNQTDRISESVYVETYGESTVVDFYDDPARIRQIYESTAFAEALRYNCFATSIEDEQTGFSTIYVCHYDNGNIVERFEYAFID